MSLRRSFFRISLGLLAGALLAAVLGSGNLVIWAEEWPDLPFGDQGLAAVRAWHDGCRRLGLADLHPWLRQRERDLEQVGWGRADLGSR